MNVVVCDGGSKSVADINPEWWAQVKAELTKRDFAEEVRVQGFDYAIKTGFCLTHVDGRRTERKFLTRTLTTMEPFTFVKVLEQLSSAEEVRYGARNRN